MKRRPPEGAVPQHTQKDCENLRCAWLKQTAQDRACALNDPDWEKKLLSMKQTARDCAMNRKLSLLTKGLKGSLDRVQIPTALWYLSCSKREIYHYDDGVFEAYPESSLDAYHPHHTIKVPAEDAVEIDVQFDEVGQVWRVIRTTDIRMKWTDLLRPEDIEDALLRCNERHLRQTEREGGISTRPPLTNI